MKTVTKYVRDAMASLPSAGAHELAVRAASMVPQKELRACLAEALVDVARIEIGVQRRESMNNVVGDSPKVRDRASWWQKMLEERVQVAGEWKMLGDCTVDDLQLCIESREQLIGRIASQIENYKRLQKLMVQHGAARVSDVPAQAEWKEAS